MANRSKQKGTAYESLIRDYLKQEWSPDIDRLPLSGTQDRGDIANFRIGEHLLAIECKNHNRLDLGTWTFEAQREAANYGALAGVVIHKRKGKGQPGDQYVTLTLRDFLDIIHAAKG
ncbi:hypothetical protein A5747_13640 [Mycobacterium sp. IS-836]|uniref:putative PDDEXK endonuclease n=1 Tax=Mycobacterium sp. IS-836 TaxID=1834160 RepID=UPI00096CD1C4|nr:hypothetical protein [Mycobacterium sp. IS-836]OMC55426.1 hypothetical protein A5747_13640 [Mycobacterium sp. IS-836]